MMIVKIFQGPGNQMFQYAYGLATSKRIGVELKLDLSWFESNSDHRSYILDRFNIETPIASEDEINYIKSCDGKNFLEYRWNLLRNKFAPRHKKVSVKEDLSVFDAPVKFPHRDCIVEGYFSTEQFFEDFEPEVRKSFQFKQAPSDQTQSYERMIIGSTIAVSIRRGDFLNNSLHNLCSTEYIHRGVEILSAKLENPNILVFSDELEWVKSNISFKHPYRFVEDLDDHMDHMRLMSMCPHHVIPNSTFSWWGAWLSNAKSVVAPDLWISGNKRIHEESFGHWVETRHTVPTRWIRIPAKLEGETLM